MNTEILNLILLTLQAQENTINTLQEELSAIQDLEDTKCDIENLDRQVNDNESNLECLESRFCEFKEITEKKSKDRDVSISSWLVDLEDDNELEARIERIETWVDTHQYNSITNEDDLKTAIINLLS